MVVPYLKKLKQMVALSNSEPPWATLNLSALAVYVVGADVLFVPAI
jgi:hypothetical protein